MGNVIQAAFGAAAPPEDRPVEGTAKGTNAMCLACKHEWLETTATKPEPYDRDIFADGVEFDGEKEFLCCPACKTYKGIFKFTYVPPAGAGIWACACGNNLMYITRLGTLCPLCGNWQNLGNPDEN